MRVALVSLPSSRPLYTGLFFLSTATMLAVPVWLMPQSATECSGPAGSPSHERPLPTLTWEANPRTKPATAFDSDLAGL
jgi:hypothetical protein